MPPKGAYTFVLHSHLPYVINHGRWPHGMDWLNEATAETYIPLLNVFNKLVNEGISPKVTIGITPVLTEQLNDNSFKEEFKEYVKTKIKAAVEDERLFTSWNQLRLARQAKLWQDFYSQILSDFQNKYKTDLVGAFRKLQDEGHIEIITCAATHGYLPLLGEDTSVQAQIKQGIRTYQEFYGRQPRGIWLPECAYRPRYNWVSPLKPKGKSKLRKGVDEFLSENGIEYFFIDSPLLKGGKAVGVYIERFGALKQLWQQFEKEYQPASEDMKKSPYELYLVNSSGQPKKPVAIFTRDPRTGIQVWSGEHGYPGDGNYLEFHKKQFPGGHRYWKITSAKSDLADKEQYIAENVEERLKENASHFKGLVKGIILENQKKAFPYPFVCAPFDTELFGHWWFEGPGWMYYVLKWMAQDPEIELLTCSEHLAKANPRKVVSIPEGSWGQGGFHWIWLNDWTKWTWKHIYEDEIKMREAAYEFGDNSDEKLQAILKQLARELLLLESSDWQFLISTWGARDYAELRVVEHDKNFKRLYQMLIKYGRKKEADQSDWEFLESVQKRDNLFENIEPKWWAKVEFPA